MWFYNDGLLVIIIIIINNYSKLMPSHYGSMNVDGYQVDI